MSRPASPSGASRRPADRTWRRPAPRPGGAAPAASPGSAGPASASGSPARCFQRGCPMPPPVAIARVRPLAERRTADRVRLHAHQRLSEGRHHCPEPDPGSPGPTAPTASPTRRYWVLRPSRGSLRSLVGTQSGPLGGRLTSRRHAHQRKHRTPHQRTQLSFGFLTRELSDPMCRRHSMLSYIIFCSVCCRVHRLLTWPPVRKSTSEVWRSGGQQDVRRKKCEHDKITDHGRLR